MKLPEKTVKSRRKEVGRLIEKWRGRLFLHGWYFETHFRNDDHPDDGHGKSTAAVINVESTYKQALITIYPSWVETSDAKKREEMLVHELVHCLTDRLSGIPSALLAGELVTNSTITHEVEALTQAITTIVFAQEWKR